MTLHHRLLALFLILAVPALTHCSSSSSEVEEPVNGEDAENSDNADAADDSENGENAEGSDAENSEGENTEGNAGGNEFAQSNEFALDAGTAPAPSNDGGNENLFAEDNFDDTVDDLFEGDVSEAPLNAEPSNTPAVVAAPEETPAAPLVEATPPAAPAQSVTPPSVPGLPKTAEENFNAFKEHFASVLGGHPEGVHVVHSKKAAVYNGPGPRYHVIAYLKRGDDVHVMRRFGSWVKIGYGKYMPLSALRSYGLTTQGLEAYQATPELAPMADQP